MNEKDILSRDEHQAIDIAAMQAIALRLEKVLIVDDDRSLREMLAGILKVKGIASLLAANAQEAMKLLDTDDRIGLVITDLRMHPVDGLDFIRDIRHSRHADISIVVISGSPHIQDAIAGMHLGIVDFLIKPIEPAQLMPLVYKELGIRL